VGLRRVVDQAPASAELFAPSALEGIARYLLSRLSGLAVRMIAYEFKRRLSRGELRGQTSGERYHLFVAEFLGSLPGQLELFSEALKAALGAHARTVPVSSTKSYTGHLIGTAGALESILCLKVIESSLVPATRNLLEADPECDLDYVPNEHRAGVPVRRCLNLSFGFGGANAALVIEGVRP
jgi:hypothetical protein